MYVWLIFDRVYFWLCACYDMCVCIYTSVSFVNYCLLEIQLRSLDVEQKLCWSDIHFSWSDHIEHFAEISCKQVFWCPWNLFVVAPLSSSDTGIIVEGCRRFSFPLLNVGDNFKMRAQLRFSYSLFHNFVFFFAHVSVFHFYVEKFTHELTSELFWCKHALWALKHNNCFCYIHL